MKQFKKLIEDYCEKVDPAVSVLPLCHTATSGYITDMIAAAEAIPQFCKVYGEELLYLFYGKASYLTEDQLGVYTDDPPITVIFRYDDQAIAGKRVLPFDSGGYDRYGFKQGYTRERYTYMPPCADRLQAMVKLIYKSNSDYLDNNVSFDSLEQYQDDSFDVLELIRVYQNALGYGSRAGQQIHTLEVQTDCPIPFAPAYLVVPYELFASRIWMNQFTELKENAPEIQIVGYGQEQTLKKRGPIHSYEYQDLMRRKVEELVRAMAGIQ